PLQQLESRTVGVALPYDVHVSHRQGHRLPAHDTFDEIAEHPISQIDGVIQAYDRDACAPRRGVKLEDALATEARRGILADRRRFGSFARATTGDGNERIHVAGW